MVVCLLCRFSQFAHWFASCVVLVSQFAHSLGEGEVSGQMLFSDKRPDLVIYNGTGCRNQLTDVVTCDPCRKDICVRAAARAGAAAE